jgi:hypothetical protein
MDYFMTKMNFAAVVVLISIMMVGLVSIANAHSQAYWLGYKTERLNAKGVYDFKSCFEQYTPGGYLGSNSTQ